MATCICFEFCIRTTDLKFKRITDLNYRKTALKRLFPRNLVNSVNILIMKLDSGNILSCVGKKGLLEI